MLGTNGLGAIAGLHLVIHMSVVGNHGIPQSLAWRDKGGFFLSRNIWQIRAIISTLPTGYRQTPSNPWPLGWLDELLIDPGSFGVSLFRSQESGSGWYWCPQPLPNMSSTCGLHPASGKDLGNMWGCRHLQSYPIICPENSPEMGGWMDSPGCVDLKKSGEWQRHRSTYLSNFIYW